MTKRIENLVENVKLGAGCLFAPILIPLAIVQALIKEEAIDRVTGKRQRINKEYQESRKRFNQENQRMETHKALYTQWAEKVTPILEEVYGNRPELMENTPITRTTLQRWGASFWDFPTYDTKAIRQGDTYIFETGPSGETRENVPQGFTIDDNHGIGYTPAEAANRFAKLITANVIREDTEVLREGIDTAAFGREPYRGIYKEFSQRVKSTERKRFIKDLKDKTGIDLRTRIKA